MSAVVAVNLIGSLVLGAAVFAVGGWARRNAAHLPPRTLPADARERRVATLRRGAVVCQVVGMLLALAGGGASLL